MNSDFPGPIGSAYPAPSGFSTRIIASLTAAAAFALSLLSSSAAQGVVTPDEHRNSKPVSYHNEKIPEGPWSIHVVKIEFRSPDYELQTTLADGVISGMTTLSEQVKAFPAGLGRPVVAINGDFYKTDPKPYRGDPQGLQLLQGELVSGPSEHPCFWMDAAGNPHTDVVQAFFRAIWPGGSTTPFGLNEERPGDGAVLYTPTMGPSTGTKGGREILLEPVDKSHGLPLRIGTKLQARILEIRETGDTPLKPGLLVFSLGPQLLVDAPFLKPGDEVQLATMTAPDLAGCQTAIGGFPRLVMDGKLVTGGVKSSTQRHPRTGVGWNNEHLFFVLVDGRQPGLSVGMTYQELANYFLKLGCTTAINLDGGGSASMWAFGQVVSSPSEGQERPIANGLVLVKKLKHETP